MDYFKECIEINKKYWKTIAFSIRKTNNNYQINLSTYKSFNIDYLQDEAIKIRDVVCNYYSIRLDGFYSKNRMRQLVTARQVSSYFCSLKKIQIKSIGMICGGIHHSTVLHGIKNVKNLMETDKKFKKEIDEITKKI
jgi:chromosomal replication initiation ATPase DnaA